MKHYLDLVSISVGVHRRQSRMTRICIVLAVFLVAVMFGLADMYLRSMTEETRRQTGDWHCKIASVMRRQPDTSPPALKQSCPDGRGIFRRKPAAPWRDRRFLPQGWMRPYFLRFISVLFFRGISGS